MTYKKRTTMYSSIAEKSFSYILTMNEFRNAIPEEHRPSWIKITTITMVSSSKVSIDIHKLRNIFTKLGSVHMKIEGSKSDGFEWKLKPTTFYNQITLGYSDQYSTKSVKVFPNGSIQVAGCSDLFDCTRIITQLSYLLKEILGHETVPIDSYRIVMINTNFSLNYNVNLMRIAEHFSANKIFNVSFEPDRYSAVKIKFKPAQDMKEVTASIFSTGKIIVTGAETLKEIVYSYNIINHHINSGTKLKVSKTTETDVFETFMGYKFVDWIEQLKETPEHKPWTFNRTNESINF
jgi:TATA-box binding protein (TBP) (component of TFIID and TFIIIB)